MLSAIIIFVYVVVFLIDFLPNAKNVKVRDNVIYCAFLSVSFAVLLLFSMDIVVPGPTGPIKSIIELFGTPSS